MGNRRDHLYRLRRLLSARRAVPAREIMERLGVSRSTLTRLLQEMGDTFHAPVIHDREAGGYRLQADGVQEFPGLWFSDSEIHALLTMLQLLGNLEATGLLGEHIEPLKQRLTELLGAAHDPATEVARRVRIQPLAGRQVRLDHFQAIGSALLQRQRLLLEYRSRGKDQTTRREISPQRLLHYRDSWYLDAWCHKEEALRRFSVDAIQKAVILDQAATDLPDTQLDQANGYGIFAGGEIQWAVLRFSPERSRWVAAETWHPNQEGKPLPDGSYEMRLPYTHDTELILDLLRHGAHVTILSPPELREAVKEEHLRAAKNLEACSGFEHGEGENGEDKPRPPQTTP